jgi:polysaccharide biosynthesis/export protein
MEDDMNIKFVCAFFIACFVFSGACFSAEPNLVYKLNQGDVVQISVWGEETLQKEVRVLPDGSITFPLAGRVEVANATTPEVEKRITEKLKTYLPDPQVTVVISSTEGNRAYVIGKVLKPGPVLLTGPMTVLQALSQAGGLDKFADLNAIKVLRGAGKNQTAIPVNYNNLIKGQGLDSNILLNTGDTILVP